MYKPTFLAICTDRTKIKYLLQECISSEDEVNYLGQPIFSYQTNNLQACKTAISLTATINRKGQLLTAVAPKDSGLKPHNFQEILLEIKTIPETPPNC